jgi:hypothetical protein
MCPNYDAILRISSDLPIPTTFLLKKRNCFFLDFECSSNSLISTLLIKKILAMEGERPYMEKNESERNNRVLRGRGIIEC